GKDNKFCKQLKKFKTKYVELYNTLYGKSIECLNNFKRFSQCEKTNTMTTALIGTTVGLIPLLGGLYKVKEIKFNPFRQLINSKKGKLTHDYRNNDDYIRNIILMDQESENISFKQGTYNIKYHSV
ncbi:CYIR protein, partial [Plasmodium cynomolgi strain B]